MLTTDQTLAIASDCKIDERSFQDSHSGDQFVELVVTKGASRIDLQNIQKGPTIDAEDLEAAMYCSESVSELRFIPYYFRANREGRGHMRVGLKALVPPPAVG